MRVDDRRGRPMLADRQRVPASRDERDRIRLRIEAIGEDEPLTRKHLETLARSVVDAEEHLAWAMVLIGNRLWSRRIRRVPMTRRLLLLPHCMRNAATCPATYDPEGLQCERCGACPLGDLKHRAESLGYHVLIAEGSPVVMQWILGGRADAILGVGCLRSLEQAFEKLQLAGIPATAVPLHASDCRDSTTDLDRVVDMIQTPYEARNDDETSPGDAAPSWIHLLRGAAGLFGPPEARNVDLPENDPLEATERLGLDFLRRGGKFYRPFITLATFDALTGSAGTGADGAVRVDALPDAVKDAARAVEIFHKASLIHDDIEDDDPFRYGRPALHVSHGTAVAINVGDYLLGRGYRLIAGLGKTLPDRSDPSPGDVVSEMLVRVSEAHTRLSKGQGAELAWKSTAGTRLSPSDVLKIYVLKTAPAFEAAMELGVLSAVAFGAVDFDFYRQTAEKLARFSRHLGVAYQIRNDLDDWLPDRMNKRIAGADARQGRPTLLRALAAFDADPDAFSVREIERRFREDGTFDKARRLVEKYAAKARETVDRIDRPSAFRRLLLHFVETMAGS